MLGSRVLDLDTYKRGAERGFDRASELDALAVLRLTPRNPRGGRLASEEQRMGLFKFESILCSG